MLVARQGANATATPKPKCGENKTLGDYSLSLHIGAVFIILGVSFSACAFPLLVKAPKLRIPPTFPFIVRHFGTGVLIATAFVHLLRTAFLSLTDQCLPKFWNEDFPAMAGALAMAAVFMIAVVEMVFSPGKNCCALPVGMMEGNNSNEGETTGAESSHAKDVEGNGTEEGHVPLSAAGSKRGGMTSIPDLKGGS
jgi:zinc transporter 1/2/3